MSFFILCTLLFFVKCFSLNWLCLEGTFAVKLPEEKSQATKGKDDIKGSQAKVDGKMKDDDGKFNEKSGAQKKSTSVKSSLGSIKRGGNGDGNDPSDDKNPPRNVSVWITMGKLQSFFFCNMA